MAVETCVWPLYEVVEGKYILSYKPKNKLPVEEYLKMQGRFAHMFKPGNEWMIEEVQKEVDKNWEELSSSASCKQSFRTLHISTKGLAFGPTLCCFWHDFWRVLPATPELTGILRGV